MQVFCLAITVYADDGWGAGTERIENPQWSDIESAIRGLNRFTHPFVSVYRCTNPRDDAIPDFEVIGGDGAYAMQGLKNGSAALFFNPGGSNDPVEIWLSDQGTDLPAKNVCRDIEVVLEAARYFFEHGELDPRLQWRE